MATHIRETQAALRRYEHSASGGVPASQDVGLFLNGALIQFETLHSQLERLCAEIPLAVLPSHILLVHQMASRSVDLQKRCIEFKREVLWESYSPVFSDSCTEVRSTASGVGLVLLWIGLTVVPPWPQMSLFAAHSVLQSALALLVPVWLIFRRPSAPVDCL